MRGLGRRGLRILAVVSPLWAFGCYSGATVLPDLEFEAGATATGSPLYPTGVDVLVDVLGPERTTGGRCDGERTYYNQLSFAAADCGPDCTVEAAGEGPQPGSVRLRVRANTPGEKVLRVDVDDEEEGAREHEITLEFADVGHVEVRRTVARDPGTTAPMLVGMQPAWCVHAQATDERPLFLERSENGFESLTSAFVAADPFGEPGRVCWAFGAVRAGEGHIRVSAAGRSLEHFPRAVADADIAEIHLHELNPTRPLAAPVETALSLDGPPVTEVVLNTAYTTLDLLVRLVTVDGQVVRGGADRFQTDRGASVSTNGGQVLTLSLALTGTGIEPSKTGCLRAAIGAASIAVPLFIFSAPGSENPCDGVPGVGGAGGAGGFGGEGG